MDEQGTLKENAAEALSALGALGQAQVSNSPAGGPSGLPFPLQKQQPPPPPPGHAQQALALLSLAEPGPSSHPNGPPNLGQLSALAAAAGVGAVSVSDSQGRPSEGSKGDEPKSADSTPTTSVQTRSRGARSANMGSDEWARQRKDNHVGVL